MRASWWRDLIAATLVVAAGVLLGALGGRPLWGLIAALGGLLGYHGAMLWHLHRWARRPRAHELPEAPGLWGEVFEQLIGRQRANRKRKKRLARILSEFQASTAALPDGAVVLTPRGEIAWFNQAARLLLGLRSPQDIGQRIANLIRHPEFNRYLAAADYAAACEIPSPLNEQTTLWLRIIPYGEGQRLLLLRDVSERRRAELARRDFVANASHELRTPLTVLRGYLDMMASEAEAGGALQAWRAPIHEMRQQALRMDALVGDLLKLARLEAGAISAAQTIVDMPRLLGEALEAARSLSNGRHRLQHDIDGELRLIGREAELRSIVGNLLANAVHYTPDGGEILLRWHADAGGASLAVSDTGIGIDPDDLPRITERFYRVDAGRSREQGGTGLGLAIVKHALELHEGRLQIESRPGQGSRFVCRFPAHRRVRGSGSA